MCTRPTKHWWKTTKIVLPKMHEICCSKAQWVQSFRSEQSKKFTKLRNSFSNSAKNIFCAIFPIYAKMFLCQCTKTTRTFTQKKKLFLKIFVCICALFSSIGNVWKPSEPKMFFAQAKKFSSDIWENFLLYSNLFPH